MIQAQQHFRYRFLDSPTWPVEFARCRRCKLRQQESIGNMLQGAKDQLRSHSVLPKASKCEPPLQPLQVLGHLQCHTGSKTEGSSKVVERVEFPLVLVCKPRYRHLPQPSGFRQKPTTFDATDHVGRGRRQGPGLRIRSRCDAARCQLCDRCQRSDGVLGCHKAFWRSTVRALTRKSNGTPRAKCSLSRWLGLEADDA